MIPLTCGIQDTQTRGVGAGQTGSLGLADTNDYIIKQGSNKVLPYSIGNYI